MIALFVFGAENDALLVALGALVCLVALYRRCTR